MEDEIWYWGIWDDSYWHPWLQLYLYCLFIMLVAIEFDTIHKKMKTKSVSLSCVCRYMPEVESCHAFLWSYIIKILRTLKLQFADIYLYKSYIMLDVKDRMTKLEVYKTSKISTKSSDIRGVRYRKTTRVHMISCYRTMGPGNQAKYHAQRVRLQKLDKCA